MLAYGRQHRTIWLKKDDPRVVQVIDQRALPHRFVIEDRGICAASEAGILGMYPEKQK